MNTITNLNTFPIGNSLDGVNIITEEINTLSLLVDGTNSMLADLNMNNHTIKNMEAGVDSLDAVNFSQLTDLRTYTDNSLNSLRNYVNSQDANILSYTDSSLNSLRNYVNSQDANILSYTDSSLNLLRNYTDSSLNYLRSYVNSQDANILSYTDSSLNLLRNYTDSSFNLLRNYTDSSLNLLRNYTDSSLNLLRNYTDSSLNLLRNYTDSSLNLLRNYVNSQDTNIINYTDSSLNLLRNYVNSQDNLKVNKAGDTMSDYLQLPEVRLTAQTTTYNSGTIDIANRTNTYAVFDSAGAGTDWAFLRQIGGSNDIHLSLDFHDDSNDGKFSLRNVNSASNPVDPTPSTFFYSSPVETYVSNNLLVGQKINASHIQLVSGANVNSQGCWIDWNYNAGDGRTNILNQKGGGAGGIAFGEVTNTNSRTYNMVLDGNGKLGIGTTTPTEKLEVFGNCLIEGNLSSSVAFVGSNSNKQVNITNNNNGIWFNPYFSSGAYNPLVSSGGKGMIFSNGTKETGDLVIGPWSDSNKGIKILGSSGYIGVNKEPTEVLDVSGNVKVSGTISRSSWSSGELIKTKIYNENTDGSGSLIIGSNSTADWKVITFNIQNPTINQSVLTIDIDCPYIIAGSDGDYITIRVFDATDAANNNYQYLLKKTQRFDSSSGGGTRSGTILPIITSYTPLYALTTYARSIYVEVANFANDAVFMCYYILNGNVTVQNTWTIKISEYKI